ncbi:MAG: hypothetical protein N5P05_001473 [Chroococcopsis gigantea SAG 12.99]|nr:hypothetical protein [Chroococcopsis gigantea SAG 12.99]
MQIKKLKFYDDEYKWKLAEMDFLPNLNLLVGVSGVGKTRILRAIKSLKSIANGGSLNGVKWSVCFLADNDIEYTWSGEFETKEGNILLDGNSEKDEQVKLIYERLIGNNEVIVSRKDFEIIFNGKQTPKLSPFESVVELLKQEEQIAPIKKSLDKIILDDYINIDKVWSLPVSIFKKYEKAQIHTLKESSLPIEAKLSIIYRAFTEEFNKIKKDFISVFPNIIDIKIDGIKDDDDIPIVLSEL